MLGSLRNKNGNAHSVIKNASKTEFIYTKTQWETTITQAFKKNTCDVKALMLDISQILHQLIKFQSIPISNETNVKRSTLQRKRRLSGHQLSKLSLHHNNQNSFKFNYEDDYIIVNFRTSSPKIRNTENRFVKTIVVMKSQLQFFKKR